MYCAAADALASSPSARRAGSSCDATAEAMFGIPSGPDRRSRTAGCAWLPNDSHKFPSSRRHRYIAVGCGDLLTQRVLHGTGQHIYRGTSVTGLTDLCLQQHVFPQTGLGETSPVRSAFLLGPRRVGGAGWSAVKGPHLRGSVVQVHRRGLPGAPDGAVDDAMKRRAGGVAGCEHTDRLFDEVSLVGRRGLRAGAVERRQVRIVVDLRQPDIGPVVARRVVDEVRLERLGG